MSWFNNSDILKNEILKLENEKKELQEANKSLQVKNEELQEAYNILTAKTDTKEILIVLQAKD